MNDIEKDILNFIMNKDIDFSQSEFHLNISIEAYQFTLDAYLEEKDDGMLLLRITTTLLKDYWKLMELSEHFKQELGEYFEVRIMYIEEYLRHQIGLNGCLRDNQIIFLS